MSPITHGHHTTHPTWSPPSHLEHVMFWYMAYVHQVIRRTMEWKRLTPPPTETGGRQKAWKVNGRRWHGSAASAPHGGSRRGAVCRMALRRRKAWQAMEHGLHHCYPARLTPHVTHQSVLAQCHPKVFRRRVNIFVRTECTNVDNTHVIHMVEFVFRHYCHTVLSFIARSTYCLVPAAENRYAPSETFHIDTLSPGEATTTALFYNMNAESRDGLS